MTTTIRALLALGACGVLLAGCGSAPSATSAGTTTSAATPTQTGPDTNTAEGRAEAWSIKFENLMADCMKAAGFQYVAHPAHYTRPAGNVAGKDPALVPYDTLKAYRQKYGYGTYYAADVYPNDPNVVAPDPGPESNPNNAIRSSLDSARQQAYDQAYDGGTREQMAKTGKKTDIHEGGCVDKITKQIGNSDDGVSTTTDPTAEAAAAQAEQQFTTDPTVLSAAQDYGSCLQQHGYTVTSVKPGVIDRTLGQLVEQEHTNSPAVDRKQGLSKEIKISLDDLECGKAYEAAAKPFVEKLLQVGVG